MGRSARVLILRAAGTNCNTETAFAFEKVGGKVDQIHINSLKSSPRNLSTYHILALPGGFTYGDDIASGKLLANELMTTLREEIEKFLSRGKLILGICNGFQILVKAGLLPRLDKMQCSIESTLTINDSSKFEDRWVYLKKCSTRCIWTGNLPDIIYLPVAHGEGKFIPRDNTVLTRLKEKSLIVFQYVDERGNTAGYPYNPNGSVENIAGITDPSGRILGLMPHPERHIYFTQHPRWTRLKKRPWGDGLAIFRNGVDYVKKKL